MEPIYESADDSLSDRLRSFDWDVARGRAVIHLTDGRRVGMPVTVEATDDGIGIARMTYSFEDHTLVITTPDGERATMEIGSATNAGPDAGHRVVYLDQGHWSALARRIHDPDALSVQEDAAAADKIIGWARDRCIVLPLSSGHVMETTPLYGAKRQHLALTMLQLSRGWHMRNPVHVRRDEIASVLVGAGIITSGHDRPEVFTLDTDSLYAANGLPQATPAAVPEYLDWLFERLSAVAANFDLLIDPQSIAPEKATGWSDELTALSRDAEFQAMPAAQRRVAAQARALADAVADRPVLDQLQRNGVSPEEAVTALLQGLQGSTDTMPFLRLYADAMGVRLLNRARWEPNDLVDMLYLACATAYADGVAAERAATHYLNAAWQGRPKPCPVLPTLRELVSHLTDLGLE
jgi:hypothetical protein